MREIDKEINEKLDEIEKKECVADLDNLPSPDVLADDIIENLQSALESFES